MKIMSSYHDFEPLSTVGEKIIGKIAEMYYSKETNYSPQENIILNLGGYQLLGALRSRGLKWGAIFCDVDGTINAKDTPDPFMLFITKLAEVHTPLEKVLPNLKSCVRDVQIKKDIFEPSQRFARILQSAGVLEKHMKRATELALVEVELVPHTLDTIKDLEKNMLYDFGLGSGGWEYFVKELGKKVLLLQENRCFGSDIPFYPDDRLKGTMTACVDSNKAIAMEKFHDKVGCPNRLSIYVDNDPAREYKTAITHGTNLNIFVDLGSDASLPEDLKDHLRKTGDLKGFYKLPGTISIFLPEARDDMRKIKRPIRIQETLEVVVSMYTPWGYRMMLNSLDEYEDVYSICRKATGAQFDSNMQKFLELSTWLIKTSYPPMKIAKVKPSLDEAASVNSEDERRESMEDIFGYVKPNRSELSATREKRHEIISDLSNEMMSMTNFRR